MHAVSRNTRPFFHGALLVQQCNTAVVVPAAIITFSALPFVNVYVLRCRYRRHVTLFYESVCDVTLSLAVGCITAAVVVQQQCDTINII